MLIPYRQLLCARLRILLLSSAVTSTWITRRCRRPVLLEHRFLATATPRGQAPFVVMKPNSRHPALHAGRISVQVPGAVAWLMAVRVPRFMLSAVVFKFD